MVGECGVAHRIGTSMNPVQAAGSRVMGDRSRGVAEVAELSAGNDAVLRGRQLGQRQMRRQ
jgi:hypothetical protein